jgi:hypothetical protein
MNYKSISLFVLASLALASCKKESEQQKELQEPVSIANPRIISPAAEELKAVDSNAKIAVMHFAKLEHDFGTISPDNVVETTFTFTNNGEANLVISKAEGSCGCTVPEYPKEPIAPGQKATVKVSFSPKGKMGMQNKTVTLTTNTETGFEKLTIKANIVK